MLGRPFVSGIERAEGITYWVESATIFAQRSLFDPAVQRPAVFRVELWKGYNSYDLILLTSLILATPGWSLRQRGRLLAIGLVLITLTEFAFFLSTIEYVQLRPVVTRAGSMLVPEGSSRAKQIVASWVYYFFQTMGRGLFPLLIYWGMIGFTWKPSEPRRIEAPLRTPSEGTLPPSQGRNAPCPCGSGKKFKRCCGKA